MNGTERGFWRLSLRAVLVLVAAAAFSSAAMMHADEGWLLTFVAFTLLVLMGAVFVAAFDRGPRQAFALGFLFCAGLHLAALRWVDNLPMREHMQRAYEPAGAANGSAGARPMGAASSTQLKRGDLGPVVNVLQVSLNVRLAPSPLLQVDGDFWQSDRAGSHRLSNADWHAGHGRGDGRNLASTGARGDADAPADRRPERG